MSRAWWLLAMGPDPETGLARPELGGQAVPDQAAVEVLLGGAAVRGRLVLREGARSQLSVTFTKPAKEGQAPPSTGQITTVLLPASGAFMRAITAAELPQAVVPAGMGEAAALAGAEAEAAATDEDGEDLGLEELAGQMDGLAQELEAAAHPGPRALVLGEDGEWGTLGPEAEPEPSQVEATP